MNAISTSALTIAVLLAVAAFLLLVMLWLQSATASTATSSGRSSSVHWVRAVRGVVGVSTTGTALPQPKTYSSPPALEKSFAVMRTMHVRMSRAEGAASTMNAASVSTSMAQLLHESDTILQAGLALMRSMRAELPVAAGASQIGLLVPADITKAQADYVDDFLVLMEMLDQMRSDQDSVLRLRVPPDAHLASLL